ncbi:MAG: PKD domain-containing protein [Bacteroidia bacterium]|nr:PKD domain-containing protein [Bacteroidia bacterium]
MFNLNFASKSLILFFGAIIYLGVLQAQPHIITGCSPNSADIGQTLSVNITGNDINWSLCCGSSCSGITGMQLYRGGTVINSTSHVNQSVDWTVANFTIPNNASYLGLWNVQSWNGASWCLISHAQGANLFNITMQPNQNAGYLSGRFYQDNDSSCTENAGDAPLKGRLFVINPGGIVATTDSMGNFGMWLPLNTYTLTLINQVAFSASCPAVLTADLLVPYDTVTVMGAMQPNDLQDLRVSMSNNTPRPGFDFHQYINYVNNGGLTLNAVLKVALDTVLTNPSSIPPWTSFSNDTAYYNLPAFGGGTDGHITLTTTVPTIPTVGFGQQVHTYAIIEPVSTDVVPYDNHFSWNEDIVGSFDPNDKTVSPEGYGSIGGISPADPLLTYRIRFQNTGNDTAFTVVVRDTFSSNLDLTTLNLLGSSHPYLFSIDSGRAAWTFSNILLPDSNVNEPASHGWVIYQVQQKAGLVHGTQIENSASIYFDFNPPVKTNSTLNTVCHPFTPVITVPHGLCVGDSVQLSTPNPGTAFFWSNGDNGNSTIVQTTGAYKLMMEDNLGCPSDTATATVGYEPIPTAGFSYSGSTLTLSFADLSNLTSNWTWDFGDGGASSVQNPSHSFPSPGTYTVCQIAGNACFADTICQQVTISCTPASAAFNYSINSTTVSFTDQSTGGAIGWNWDFGNGSTSTSMNPTHQFTNSGTYTVCLIATNGCGYDTTCQTITVCKNSYANFTVNPVNYEATFTDQSTNNPVSWSWNFGDGNTSTQANPVHLYAANGTYNACLTVTNACGFVNTYCETVHIICVTPTAAFSKLTVNLTGTFTDLSSGTPTGFSWTFGDGGTSTQQNATHTYPTQGTYTVCHVASNTCGTNTSCQQLVLVCQPPVSGFTHSLSGATATFTDQSTGGAASWTWNFGDGNTSSLQNPGHTYLNPGSYTVCQIAFNACGSDTTCSTVTVCAPLTAQFTSGGSGLTASFTDQSTGGANTWLWNFGDGNSSTQQNPGHTYAAPGSYTVCLTITDACTTSTSCMTVTVSCAAPTAAFTSSANGLAASFTDQSTGGATTWSWNFGDGNSSALQNPSHTYALPGSYTVCLVSGSICGTNTVCQTVTVSCAAPSANFGSSGSGLSVSFTDQSTGGASTWSWDFGDGNTSTQQNPSHTYALPGNYTVCLVSGSICGNNTICQTITVCLPLVSSFSTSTNSLTANFTDQSTGGAGSWQWDFGDGNSSTQQNPSHAYALGGTYNVCLSVTNSCTTSTVCQSVTVCVPVVAQFSQIVNNYIAYFTNFSSGSATGWHWDFGDGNTSTQQNPSHTYASNGTYTACLISSNSCAADTFCTTVTVNCPSPGTAFTHSTNGLTASFTDQSTGSVIGWAWDFGDGGTSVQQHPSHTYANNGNYNVCLVTTNACGSNTLCQSVTVCAPVNGQFNFVVNNFDALFVDQSTGGTTAWAWDFGDGNTSTLQNPTHSYTVNGTYNVCLISSSTCSSDTVCKTVTINCVQPLASFTWSVSGNTVTFAGQATVNPTGWEWNFGDGQTSNAQNPSHTYASPDTFHVCLVVQHPCGNDTICEPLILTGLSALPDGDQVLVYPNPASDRLFVGLNLAATRQVDLELYDASGKLLLQQFVGNVTSETVSLDLGQISAGIYFLHIRTDAGVLTRKVSISRE